MATITAKVDGLNTTLFGVEFKDSVGQTDDERLIAYFTEAGYDVAGAEGFAIDRDPQLDKPIPAIGTTLGPDAVVPPRADAADPRNDLVPVGGVKSDGTVVAGAQGEDGELVAPKPDPSSPVQETGNPDEQSAVPATANPPQAAVSPTGEPLGTAEPQGTVDSTAAQAEATQQTSGGIISTDPAVPATDDPGKHAADAPADTVPTAGDPAGDPAADVADTGSADATSSARTKKAAS